MALYLGVRSSHYTCEVTANTFKAARVRTPPTCLTRPGNDTTTRSLGLCPRLQRPALEEDPHSEDDSFVESTVDRRGHYPPFTKFFMDIT